MLHLIKSEYIFGRFCKDIHIIEDQKCGLSHIYFLNFLFSTDQFLETFQIDIVIYVKILIVKSDSIESLQRL